MEAGNSPLTSVGEGKKSRRGMEKCLFRGRESGLSSLLAGVGGLGLLGEGGPEGKDFPQPERESMGAD
jgi:hypothetical protein